MSAIELVDELRRRAVVLSVADERLVWDAPKGAVTPDLLIAMRQHKAELLMLLVVPPTPTVDPDVPAVVRCNWLGCNEPVRLVRLHDGSEEQRCGLSHPQGWEPVTFTQDTAARYPCTISWAKTYGYLAIRDPFTGELHEVRTKDVPTYWRDAARLARPVAEVGAR